MKKVLFILASSLLILSSCTPGGCYVLKGTVKDSLAALPGTAIVLTDMVSGEKDTIAIENGQFTHTGSADIRSCKQVTLAFPGTSAVKNKLSASFIPEEGTIKVNLDNRTVTGGDLNARMQAFSTASQTLVDSLMVKYDQFKAGTMSESQFDAAEAAYTESIVFLASETVKANSDNYLGLAALKEIVYDIDLEQLDAILSGCTDFIGNNSTISRIRSLKVAEKASCEGNPFIDFSGTDPDGKAVSLSDFVGKGKYTLVDFWASWCGPCRREVPNIKEAYERFSGKGLTVVGVAVWDGDNSGSKKAMQELGMKWNQIFVGEDKTSTDSYGIAGIPQIILFAPDGTICKRDLRGEAICSEIAKLLK